MLYFRSEEHVAHWCRQWKLKRGALLSLGQVWQLAQTWYDSDRSDPSWRRFTLDEAEGLLKSLGLTSPFWNLR